MVEVLGPPELGVSCKCEHSDHHPNGDCPNTAEVQVEAFGIRQSICWHCFYATKKEPITITAVQ